MRRSRKVMVLCSMLLLFLSALPAHADKSSVEIEVLKTAEDGAAIVIQVKVKHHGNSFIHYTEWVSVKANGEEIARWDFSKTSRPEAENFTKVVKYEPKGSVEIEAEASCKLHGSAGKARHKVEAR